jgi:hypothetical protein
VYCLFFVFWLNMSNIEGHLREIGKKLWDRGGNPGSGHAAIMVGAGFSRNAQPLTRVAGPFPDWENLSKQFLERLYPECAGCCCGPQTDGRADCDIWRRRQRLLLGARETSGALRLAEMFDAVHGRAALDQVLAAAIPDSHYDPGRLHQELLLLPWSDIFTTNWDTLLERAVDLYDRSYSVVNTPKQIATRRAPRIVKLHGTLRVGTRLIFTERDFLSYSAEFAPFVSLVQQAMMENIFVLVGFSGEDPNFLHWMSWVRRELGDYIQRVYLIDVNETDEAQRRLLAERGVIPLNIRSLASGGGDNNIHERALSAFFDRLRDGRNIVRANLRWPEHASSASKTTNFFHLNSDKAIVRVKGRIEDWQSRVEEAPQWLSLPERNRRLLASNLAPDGEFSEIADFILSGTLKDPESDARGPAESGQQNGQSADSQKEILRVLRANATVLLLKLRQLAHIPPDRVLAGTLSHFLAAVFALKIPDGSDPLAALLGKVDRAPATPDMEPAVSDALVALTKYGRLTDNKELFDWGTGQLEARTTDAEISSTLAAEAVLWHLGRSDPLAAVEALEKLSPHPSHPRWGLRKAALLAELNRNEPARELLRKTVNRVRKLRFEADQPRETVWQHSREGWAFYTYRDLLFQDKSLLEEQRKFQPYLLPVDAELDEYGDRLTELGPSLCDPRPDIAALEAELLEAAHEAQPISNPKNGHGNFKPALTYISLMETAGLNPRTVRHSRVCPSVPLAVTAAMTLWTTHYELAVALLMRAASPADLDQGPLTVIEILNHLDDPAAIKLLNELDKRADRLIKTLNRHDMPAEYCEGRFTLIATIVRLLAAGHPECIEPSFKIACKWHDSPSLARIPGAFGAIRRIFSVLMNDVAFPWDRCFTRMFGLFHPVRSGEPWGWSRWPDPFEALVIRTASTPDGVGAPPADYKVSSLGDTVARRYASIIVTATASKMDAIDVALELTEPEVASVRRRITFIEAAKGAGAGA